MGGNEGSVEETVIAEIWITIYANNRKQWAITLVVFAPLTFRIKMPTRTIKVLQLVFSREPFLISASTL